MSSITRRTFLGRASALTALGTLPSASVPSKAEGLEWRGGEVRNAAFRVILDPREGLRSARVVHAPSGMALADGKYSYSFGRPAFRESQKVEESKRSTLLSLRGTALEGQLEVVHEFRVPHDHSWIEEQLSITNRGAAALDLHCGRCGFVLPLSLSEGAVTGEWAPFKFTAIPFRREPNGYRKQYADFKLEQILNHQFSSELWALDTTVTPSFASEGWAWTDGKLGFLVTKYCQKGIEWSLLDRVPLGDKRVGLRWGGCGIYRGNPEHGAWLGPGESHSFGVTRLTAYEGGVKEGFYAFREEMGVRGHGCPKAFNPPVHWNELYDNKLWWLPGYKQGDPAMRKKYYSLADMKNEAAKAKALGCEALYMDPGWDTNFASKIWDKERLGTLKSFTEMLKKDYGLKCSLHTPLSGWCNPSSYSSETYRVDRFGRRLKWNPARGDLASPICGASRQYLEETAKRLKVLARGGVVFFMFDGTMYHGQCWDPNHGHRVPSRREEHVQGMCRLARMVHSEYPHVLIEMHDPVIGGYVARYTPSYYGHGRASEGEQYTSALGYDSNWAFELMWEPLGDLLKGGSIVLYYHNLAYGLPLYIHIDLRKDNSNALAFWWNASTCRHLGVGGTPKDPAVRKAHKEAMTTYRRLEPFFKAGTFYGIDETVHVHVHPNQTAAVVNCFNLDDQPREREVEFIPRAYGLDATKSFNVKGVRWRGTEKGYLLNFKVPSHGHQLAELTSA